LNELVLITGGAGFIGLNLCRNLLLNGYRVRVLDSFSSQVHESHFFPEDILKDVELIRGDVRDRVLMSIAMNDVDIIVHLAAETGTGQSMYSVAHYCDVNIQGTAAILDLLMNGESGKKVHSLVVASSRSIYGEGAYKCSTHGIVYPETRPIKRLEVGMYEPLCPHCSSELVLIPTKESSALAPMSIYAMTKLAQEQAMLMCARARGINGFALRYQNVYGPGQSLKNPYTGILAVFSNLARQGKNIEIYEDGKESRDFVYIDDVVEVTTRAIMYSDSFVGPLNVGSGVATTVNDVAANIKKYFNSDVSLTTTGVFRFGDIRHNVADISLLRKVLGYTPQVSFELGVARFLDWASGEEVKDNRGYDRSREELISRGLLGRVLNHD